MITAGMINRSALKFRDYGAVLETSGHETFAGALANFICFCESDEVFSIIHEQLLNVPGAVYSEWEGGLSKSGRGTLNFPEQEEPRMAIMYGLLRSLHYGRVDIVDYVFRYFHNHGGLINPRVMDFNKLVVSRFVKDVGYKLDEIKEKLPLEPSAVVPNMTVQIIHSAGNVIQQSAVGNNISQDAVNNSLNEIDVLFGKLLDEIRSINQPRNQLMEQEDLVNEARKNANSSSPSKAVIGALLAALPQAANVATIISSISSML